MPDYNKITSNKPRRAAPSFSFGGNNIRAKANPKTSSTPQNVGPNSYKQSQSIGKQTISVRPSSPTWGLGKASRSQVQSVCSPGYQPVTRDNYPGPGVYNSSTSIGSRQLLSTNTSSPCFGQGTSNRPGLTQKSNNPGPGYYRVPSSSQ